MADYKRTIFIDSNVVLEAKSLVELPWAEVDAEGPVLILVVPQVLKEVDSKKRDGRLATRARDFNRRMGEMIDNGGVVCLRDSNPKVDISFAICNKIDWDAYDDLDPSEGDCRVVAEILNTRGVQLHDCIFISQDINPLLLASRRGIKIFRAAGSWLATPEQSPQEKEIARLKRQVLDYSKTEPEFSVQIAVNEKVKIFRVTPFEKDEFLELILHVQDLNPRVKQNQNSFLVGSSLDYDGRYEERYDKFISSIPDLVEDIPRKLELTYGQIPFSILIENCGKMRAENLHVEVQVLGGWANERPIFGGGLPHAPRPERYNPVANLHFNNHVLTQREVGRHEVEVDELKRSTKFVAQCADFRQQQQWNLNGVLWLDPHMPEPAKIILNITAANFHGAVKIVKSVDKEIVTVSPNALLDKGKGQLVGPSYVRDFIEAAVKERRYSDFEIEKDE